MKKFLCMMMAVLMVLAMAACGGEPANNGGNDTPDATTVKIGGIGPPHRRLCQLRSVRKERR